MEPSEFTMSDLMDATSVILKKGMQVELEVETLAFGGRGVSRKDGYVVFVEGGLPGQTVSARVTRKRKGYAEARVLEVLSHSKDEVEPTCSHFGECGGCRFQNLSYEAQLFHKKQQVAESLQHIGGFATAEVAETLGSPEQLYYRNKMEYSFGRTRWLTTEEIKKDDIGKSRDFALGLHVRGRFDRILDIDKCHLQPELGSEILGFVREFAVAGEFKPYSTFDHRGLWRHLVIRFGHNTGEVLVNIVTAGVKKAELVIDDLATQLTQRFPGLTSIVNNINRKKGQTAIGDEERVLHGPGVIRERIGEREYQVSANSFFQTNTRGAEQLYDTVATFAGLTGGEVVYDLYAGAGTISIHLANQANRVVGFEVVEAAVKDARANCDLNQVENCAFVAGDLKDSLDPDKTGDWGSPDTIIIDPPRAGMHADVVNRVLQLSPAKIVYVSCNPTTFARDANLLCAQAYSLEAVQPVDMFPMTPHIELVSLLTKK